MFKQPVPYQVERDVMLQLCRDSQPFLPTLVRCFDDAMAIVTTPFAPTTLSKFAFEESHFFRIALNVLLALRCLHAANWCHCDLSPGNVLLELAASLALDGSNDDDDDDGSRALASVKKSCPKRVLSL